MINEYNKPAAWKYVETPYAEMLKHGMVQQANYDEAVGAMAEYDAKLGALKRIDEDTYQRVVSKYDQDFRDMYDQYGGDWGAMKNKVKQRLGAETANPYYNLNRAHVEEYEKMQDLNRQLRANGQSPLTFSKVPLSLTKDGKLIKAEDIKYNIEGMLDWGKAEREISDFALQEEHNSGETSLAGLTDEDVVKLGNKLYLETVKTTTSGIREKQVLNKINNMFANLMDTKEGKQKYRALMNSEEFGINGATSHLVEAKMKEDLLKTAYLKIHQSYDVDRQTIGNAAYGRSGGSNTSTNDVTGGGYRPNRDAVSLKEDSFDLSLKKLGETFNKAKSITQRYKDFLKTGMVTSESTAHGSPSIYSATSEQGKKELAKLKSEYNNYKKEIVTIANEALKEGSTVAKYYEYLGLKVPSYFKTSEDVEFFYHDPIAQSLTSFGAMLNDASVSKESVVQNQDFIENMNRNLQSYNGSVKTLSETGKEEGELKLDFNANAKTTYVFNVAKGQFEGYYSVPNTKKTVRFEVPKDAINIGPAKNMKIVKDITEKVSSSKAGESVDVYNMRLTTYDVTDALEMQGNTSNVNVAKKAKSIKTSGGSIVPIGQKVLISEDGTIYSTEEAINYLFSETKKETSANEKSSPEDISKIKK